MLLLKAPHRRRSHALVVFSLLVFALLAQDALAQQVDIKVQAKELVSKGLQSQVAGRFDEAIGFYKAAYDLVPHPELLFNLGQAYRLRGDRIVALDYYRKYLAIQPDGRASKEAQEWMTQIERSMREEAAEAARKFEEQRLADEVQKAEAARKAEEASAAVTARPVEAPQSAAVPMNNSAMPASSRAHAHPRPFPWQKASAIAMGVVGVTSLAASGYYIKQANDEYERYEDLFHKLGKAHQQTEDAYQETHALKRYSIGLGITGGILAAAGIALWLSPPLFASDPQESKTSRLSPFLDDQSTGFVYEGAF